MHTTWYVLENGQPANPDDCAPDASGRLVHKSGTPVAMRGDVPSSRAMSADDLQAAGANRELKPAATGRGYRTRAAKAD